MAKTDFYTWRRGIDAFSSRTNFADYTPVLEVGAFCTTSKALIPSVPGKIDVSWNAQFDPMAHLARGARERHPNGACVDRKGPVPVSCIVCFLVMPLAPSMACSIHMGSLDGYTLLEVVKISA